MTPVAGSVTLIDFGSIGNLTVPFLTASARVVASTDTVGRALELLLNPIRPSTIMEPFLKGDNVGIIN